MCQSFDLCVWVVFTVLQRECKAVILQLRWRKIKLSQVGAKAEQDKVMHVTAQWRLVMFGVALRQVTTGHYIRSPPRCSQLWSSSLPSQEWKERRGSTQQPELGPSRKYWERRVRSLSASFPAEIIPPFFTLPSLKHAHIWAFAQCVHFYHLYATVFLKNVQQPSWSWPLAWHRWHIKLSQ